MLSFIHKYSRCSLFHIYSVVGVENMCSFIQQYFKCLLFHIYPQVGENNMFTFISIRQIFTISHIFPCWGKYTILQNKRMRRCGVPPPPIIFERLKLPQFILIIYRRKENLSESPNHKNIGKISWLRDFMSNFREIGGI